SGPASARWRCWIPAVTAFDFAENADLGTSRCRFPSNRDTYSLNYEHWGHKLRGLLDSRNDSAAPRLFGQALDSSSMALTQEGGQPPCRASCDTRWQGLEFCEL